MLKKPASILLLCIAAFLNASCASLLGPPEKQMAYPGRVVDKVTLYNPYYDNYYYHHPLRIFGWFGHSNFRFGSSFMFDETLASHNLLPRYHYLIYQENGEKIAISLLPEDNWPIGKCVNVLVGENSGRVDVIAARNCNPKPIPPGLQ